MAYIMNEFSVITYAFKEKHILEALKEGMPGRQLTEITAPMIPGKMSVSLTALTLVWLVVMVQTVLPAAVLMMPAAMAVTAALQALVAP